MTRLLTPRLKFAPLEKTRTDGARSIGSELIRSNLQTLNTSALMVGGPFPMALFRCTALTSQPLRRDPTKVPSRKEATFRSASSSITSAQGVRIPDPSLAQRKPMKSCGNLGFVEAIQKRGARVASLGHHLRALARFRRIAGVNISKCLKIKARVKKVCTTAGLID
jgi:hypothetical protein